MKMKPIHLFLMLCTVAVWGFNFVTTRVALEVFSPEQMAFARSALTLAVLLPWWKPFQRIPWQLMVSALAIGTLSFYLLYQAIKITESLTTVAVATQLMPPLSALMALLIYRELIATRKWVGILISTSGAIYLAGATTSSLSVVAFGLTVLAVLFYSGSSVVIGKSKSVGVWRILAWTAAMSLPPLGLLAGAAGPLFPDPELIEIQHWLAFLFTVIFSGLLGQAMLFILYRKYPVSDVAPWALFIPFFAGLFSIIVYGESISFSLVLGGAIILIGVWVQQKSEAKPAEVASTL